MARTIRRSADFARRHLLQQDAWNRQDISLGRTPPSLGPRGSGWGWPEWELNTDNYGSDSDKPYKRDAIREHTSSIRRFVRDALARGVEPIVCNERSRWYSGVGVVGTTIPIDTEV